MSDQAQGLRVLADQMRGDQPDPTHHTRDPFRMETWSSIQMGRVSTTGHPSEDEICSVAVADVRVHSPSPRPAPIQRARVIAVTSGKGGVGKSNFCANLAVTLGQRDMRVILLDADMGLANAHILLGASPPYSLEHVMLRSKTVPEVLHTAAPNVRLIAGGSGIAHLANLTSASRGAMLHGLGELDGLCDLIVIDTGAGVADNVLAFLSAVTEVVLITTPEPTAITNAYATIKIVSQENRGARLMLVVNMVHSSGEGAVVAQRLTTISRQFLNLDVEYLGCIPIDPAVPRAVRARVPFISTAPGSAAAGGMNQIIASLGYEPDKLGTGADGFVARMQRFFGSRGARQPQIPLQG